MAARGRRDSRMDRLGLDGFNTPKRTPYHPRNSHVVLAKEGSIIKVIRFGKQGESRPESSSIPRGRLSAAYWAAREEL